MNDDLRFVGRTHAIHDAGLKVAGKLPYAADLRIPGMLFARLLLSPISHGTIRGVDATRAKALPGVVEVFSHENSTDRLFNRCRRLPGQEGCLEDEALFAQRVRFVGDRVAAAVATSREARSGSGRADRRRVRASSGRLRSHPTRCSRELPRSVRAATSSIGFVWSVAPTWW